jgi:hypothetical protein
MYPKGREPVALAAISRGNRLRSAAFGVADPSGRT